MKGAMPPGSTAKGQDRHQRRMKLLGKADDRPIGVSVLPEPANYEKAIVIRMRSAGKKLK